MVALDRLAGRDRESVHAHRPARRQAHADRADHRGGGDGQDPAFVDTGLNLVHVDDVALGHFLALERGVTGERYILGGANLPLQQMLADIAGLTGRKPPTIKLPRGPLYPLALGAEFYAKFSGKEPFVTVDALRMSKNKMYFTSAKAERELGYTARPYGEGLSDALDWFRANGYLSRK